MKSSKHLKTILHSKRANIFYLEKCKILLNAGRVEYLTQEKKKQAYYNIPVANTTFILLGIGSSVTQAAMRHLASAGVLVGFCGNQGTPLLSAPEISWFLPSNEYRPTEYMQKWYSFWIDEQKRLEVAKNLQLKRIEYLYDTWSKDNIVTQNNFNINMVDDFLIREKVSIEQCRTNEELLLAEARKIKKLYGVCANSINSSNFVRNPQSNDLINTFLTHGNYLAYGVAATVLWVLGISHSFPVLHGKTRRGGLVFDVADIIKDSFVLPLAFISAKNGDYEQEYREMLSNCFIDNDVYSFLFDYIKDICYTFEK